MSDTVFFCRFSEGRMEILIGSIFHRLWKGKIMTHVITLIFQFDCECECKSRVSQVLCKNREAQTKRINSTFCRETHSWCHSDILLLPHFHLMSWALSWGLWGRSLTFRQSRNSCKVAKGSWVTGHLSESLHTSKPTRATRMSRGL